MNELIKIESPDGRADIAQAAHNMVVERERKLVAEFAEIAEKLTPSHFGETKGEWTRLKKMDAELKELIERVKLDAIRYAKSDALLFQLMATRKNLKAVYDENWAKFVELRDADKPENTKHTYVVRLLCTDAALGKVLKAATKEGCEDVLATSAQSDKAVKQIAKWFEENV